MALASTDVSESVSAVSYSDLDLGANAVALAVGTNVYGISGASSDTDLTSRSHVVVCTKSTLAGQTMPAALALTAVAKGVSAVSFDDLDLDVNHVGGGVSWASPENSAGIETYVTNLATGPAGLGGALTGRMAVGTKVYAVSSDTGSAGKSHVVVHTKSTLAELTTPNGSGVDGRFGERLRGFLRRSGLGCERRGSRCGLDSAWTPRSSSGTARRRGLGRPWAASRPCQRPSRWRPFRRASPLVPAIWAWT